MLGASNQISPPYESQAVQAVHPAGGKGGASAEGKRLYSTASVMGERGGMRFRWEGP